MVFVYYLFISNFFVDLHNINIITKKMNLLEKLHPVYEDKLSKANLEYPSMVAKICEELEKTEFVTELKFGTIMDLRSLCGWHNSPFDYFTE